MLKQFASHRYVIKRPAWVAQLKFDWLVAIFEHELQRKLSSLYLVDTHDFRSVLAPEQRPCIGFGR